VGLRGIDIKDLCKSQLALHPVHHWRFSSGMSTVRLSQERLRMGPLDVLSLTCSCVCGCRADAELDKVFFHADQSSVPDLDRMLDVVADSVGWGPEEAQATTFLMSSFPVKFYVKSSFMKHVG
jgi:hypothetical protein